MTTTADRTAPTMPTPPPVPPMPPMTAGHVRLVYHYRDGHDFVTDAMLLSEALAYLPLLRAVRVDDGRYEAAFGSIELRTA